ncbi:MAG: site-2 protease family protein, partial [Acidimicrobiia bacterium]|nr:site-2 protease family protein [Acidimicrobiia bacterium]
MSTLRLGRVLGIPVEIHWSILGVVALITGNLAIRALPLYAPGTDLRWRLVAALVGVILFFASILAHELGHSLVALGHGVGVSGITLWLVGGMAELDRMVPTARAEARIAAAGPAVSGLLAVFFSAVAVIGYELGAWRLAVAVAAWLGFVNLIVGVFNLAPAAPLDGGRILTAALWRRMGDAERARVLAGRCGLVLSVLLVLGGVVQLMTVGLLEGWVMAVVGLFVFQAARTEIRSAVVRGRLRSTPVAALAAASPPSLPDSTSVLQLGRWAGEGASRDTAYPVVRWGLEPVGYVVPGALASIPPAQQSWTQVG